MGTSKEIWDKALSYITNDVEEIVLPQFESDEIIGDFKHFMISLSRYKFAGKMLEGKKSCLEIGCNTGFKTMLLSQFVEKVVGVDYEEAAIQCANERFANDKRSYICADVLKMNPLDEKLDAVVSLDVIEHIDKRDERSFMNSIVANLTEQGICIIGTPNITAAEYQSEESRLSHINLYSHDRLRSLLNEYFYNVFMFGMNDEIVHTGFPQMSHYIFAMGVGKKTTGGINNGKCSV